jgi:peptide/nickel transport system ATP-binding protein
VETLPARDLANARHDYTKGLLRCVPELARPDTMLPTLKREAAWLA